MTDFRTATTPLPDTEDRVLADYWAGTRAGELRLQTCASCSHVQWPPRAACHACQSLELDWTATRTVGQLFSWTVVGFTTLPGFVDLVPYAVGAIELDDVPVRVTGYIEADPESLTFGDRLVADFIDKGDGVVVPIWRPQCETKGLTT